MELLKNTLCSEKNCSLFIIRTGIGTLFCIFGMLKLIGGQQTWIYVGSAMSIFGITCMPMVWGLCAALAELCGGVALITNHYTKIGAALIGCVMVVAAIMLITQGKEFASYSYPLSMLIVMLGLIFSVKH